MHMLEMFGHTYHEVEKAGIRNIHKFINQSLNDTMDVMLAKTIQGFSDYVKEARPDLLVVHGDRVEALGAATVGCLNNILVAHVEGGELSGTIDGSLRHAISKLAHHHFAANQDAAKRLRQLGENGQSIHVVGSPDLDMMCSASLPSLEVAKSRYEIPFEAFGICLFHPVTTEHETIGRQAEAMLRSLSQSGENAVLVYPNNDLGSSRIIEKFEQFRDRPNFRFYPSLRFEYFLTLLKNSRFIIGNSSAGVREAPFYGVPSIDIGSRQAGRIPVTESVTHVAAVQADISEAIGAVAGKRYKAEAHFGDGNSTANFLEVLMRQEFWDLNRQKVFSDIG